MFLYSYQIAFNTVHCRRQSIYNGEAGYGNMNTNRVRKYLTENSVGTWQAFIQPLAKSVHFSLITASLFSY